MTQKRVALITYVITLATTVAVRPSQAITPARQEYSRKELHHLIASAKNPDDYQKLAKYFHYRELVYRAKAQREIDAYVNCVPITLWPQNSCRGRK